MLCAKSPLPTPLRHLSRSTTPHVTGLYHLTPLTAALKIPNLSLEQKLAQRMGPVVLMQHEEPQDITWAPAAASSKCFGQEYKKLDKY